MNYTYTIYTSAISPEYCKYLTDTALTASNETEATVGNRVIDPKIRAGKLRWIRPGQTYRELFLYLNSFAERANREQFGFDISYGCESFQYTEYRAEDQGHYSWHIDCHLDDRTPVKDRKLSMVVQLSPPEEYEGGIFCIDNFAQPKFDIARWAPQGSVIVFPSYIKHCVTPVTTGVRKSLVTWYMGPPFR
jgi:PKHD-type hydroxylase